MIGLIRYMLKLSPTKEGLNCVLAYMANLSCHKHVDEVLETLYKIVEVDDLQLNSYLAGGLPLIFYIYWVFIF